MDTTKTCQHCGKPIGPKTVGGLCPECLLKAGLGSGVHSDPANAGEAGPGSKRASAPPIAEIAGHFPQLEIIELLGAGGMGAVYKARQREIDRLVALKVLPQQAASDPGFSERFTREARALAKLSHSNIVALYEFGQVNGLSYFIMEFVDGLNLRQLEQAGKLSARQALQIIPQICEALQFAHDEGVVHRDIKPENVLLDKKGRVKIADFGLAKILGFEPKDLRLTGARDVMGTPHYMAPEQVEHPQTVDHRADIYSLGVVFYEMLTGELPLGKFQAPSKKVQVDVRLDEVVLHALAKEPERRYQHASEVKTDLEAIARSPESQLPEGLRPEISPAATLNPDPTRGSAAGRFKFGVLPDFLPGERILHFKKCVWLVHNKSWPLVYRLFFSLPPLWEAGLYVTDRRVIFVGHYFRLLTQEFSQWFPTVATGHGCEELKRVVAGASAWLGSYLDLISEYPERRWWRQRELRLRLYLRQPELWKGNITAAVSAARPPASAAVVAPRPSQVAPIESPTWIVAARFLARLLGTLWGMLLLVLLAGEGSPPIGAQPVAVQLEFAAIALTLAGFIAGWWRDGWAALLTLAGWTLFHLAERHVPVWSLFHVGAIVGALFTLVWAWSHKRNAVTAVAAFPLLFGLVINLMQLKPRPHSAGQPAARAAATVAVPPVVIQTVPESGADKVDPALTELRVTFSKPMQDSGWSWTTLDMESFPETTGKPRFLPDGRTCVLPVKLSPGKLYATWINSADHKNFTDLEGQPALAYLLIFETRK